MQWVYYVVFEYCPSPYALSRHGWIWVFCSKFYCNKCGVRQLCLRRIGVRSQKSLKTAGVVYRVLCTVCCGHAGHTASCSATWQRATTFKSSVVVSTSPTSFWRRSVERLPVRRKLRHSAHGAADCFFILICYYLYIPCHRKPLIHMIKLFLAGLKIPAYFKSSTWWVLG